MNRFGYALLGVAMLFGCSDDNNGTPDSPTGTTVDARSVDAGATADASTIDAGATNTVTVALSNAGEPTLCGSGGTGSATITISADNSTVTVDATYLGLSQAAAGAGHIHFGTTTDAGPIVLPFPSTASTVPSPVHAVFTAAMYTNAGMGNPTAPATFAAFVTQLKTGGHAYVNFHTTACSAGEIRGEIPAFPQQ